MTIFDIAPLSHWRTERRRIKAQEKSLASDAVQLRMTLRLERLLRQMVEAENAELRQQVQSLQADILANDAYFVDRNDDGTWAIVRTMTADNLLQDAKRESALLAERVQQLEAQLAYARHCGA